MKQSLWEGFNMTYRKLSIFVMACMMVILAACSDDSTQDDVEASDLENVNESGMPIVEESIELDIFTGKSLTNVKTDWDDILIWNEYEDMTNIDVEWRQ